MAEWAEEHGVTLEFIKPGKPMQNGFIERFNRSYRQAVLDMYVFQSLKEVREQTEMWLKEYNEERPHDALGDMTPREFLLNPRPGNLYFCVDINPGYLHLDRNAHTYSQVSYFLSKAAKIRIVRNGDNAMETAVEAFRKNGVLRTSQAIRLGIHPRTLYQMRDANRIAQISRGVYRLADLPEVTNPDLVAVATRVPEAVICLVSALAFHEITTEVPHEVYIALPPGIHKPRIDYPPLRDFRFSKETLSVGVEKHRVDSVTVKVFDPEKTVADCFKFRNKIGLDVALEALKLCRARRGFQLSKLIRYAKICRVERVMRPYLEAMS